MFPQSFGFIAAAVLGSTFLLSGLGKLRDLRGFVLGVLEYEVLPRPWAITYGRLLPFIEVICGSALLIGLFRCFGSRDNEPLSWVTLARLVILLACAAIAVDARGNAFLVPPRVQVLPALFLSLGLLLGLYLLRAIPAVRQIWHMKSAPAPTRSRRVNLRSLPLEPLAVVLNDRTQEASQCGNCEESRVSAMRRRG